MRKKYFWVQKNRESPQKVCCFLELLHEIANYRSADLRPEKKVSSTDEPLGFMTKIFFNGYLWQ
jgi:hypothetical protein